MKPPMVNKARDLAVRKLAGMVRGNGHPFMEHPDGVAAIVEKEIGLSPQAVAAVYLHEAGRNNPDLQKEIAETFEEEVIGMVSALNKNSSIKP